MDLNNAGKYHRFGQDKAQTEFTAIQWLDGNIINKSDFILVRILSAMKSPFSLCEDLVFLFSAVWDLIRNSSFSRFVDVLRVLWYTPNRNFRKLSSGVRTGGEIRASLTESKVSWFCPMAKIS